MATHHRQLLIVYFGRIRLTAEPCIVSVLLKGKVIRKLRIVFFIKTKCIRAAVFIPMPATRPVQLHPLSLIQFCGRIKPLSDAFSEIITAHRTSVIQSLILQVARKVIVV